MIPINSHRKYLVVNAHTGETHDLDIDQLVTPDKYGSEILYALNDILDKVLDMKIMEFLLFQPNRDDKTSKAIIIRKQ